MEWNNNATFGYNYVGKELSPSEKIVYDMAKAMNANKFMQKILGDVYAPKKFAKLAFGYFHFPVTEDQLESFQPTLKTLHEAAVAQINSAGVHNVDDAAKW